MSRFIHLFFFVLIIHFSYGQEQNISKKIESALKKAKKENKQVFVNYFSSNCPSSKNMKKQLRENKLKSILNSNYIVVNIEIPKNKVSDYVTCSNPLKSFSGNHCKEIKFPFWYTLDTLGRETASSFKDKNEGFIYTDENITDFIKLIENNVHNATVAKLDHQKNNIASK